MNNKTLFADFDSVPTKAWKQKIQVDLKGADYNETLVWNSPEGLKIKPFYNRDDYTGDDTNIPAPPEQWSIGQRLRVKDAKQANKEAHDLLAKGIESLVFQIPDAAINPKTLFEGIDLRDLPVYLEFDSSSLERAKPFLEYAKGSGGQLFPGVDPLGNLARTGNWEANEAGDFEMLGELLLDFPEQPVILIETDIYQNAGANAVQQLAYALAHANEYLIRYRETLEPASQKAPIICFRAGMGANYFSEIAKLRALRLLWNSLAPEYQLPGHCHIVAQPSKRNKTLYDYNVNMLRTTTECMSAVLGGANTVINLPYDALYHESNDFGDRISRNQLLILKKESYFDKVSNAADGAYYIESLTLQLAEEALALFKSIEKGGGWLAQMKNQTLQRKIRESAAKEQQAYDSGELVLIGSNKYPNPADRMKDNLEKSPFLQKGSRKTAVEPILAKRLAEKEEQKRLQDE
ncbi:methylmalonyl-CoA mutase subunit beta [Lentiprolixibacter aurantiacus]|uniref:Methylmalonyl-CoA mutase subunit beta n=1 Tax=Lentiprolixibacter aurantiacus TaxID=2993939 RepID=A0AAE3MMZ4_9FLAO|nr:methylmalonyl-CoA mutase subunit beta [Lentiprolixibacter aurantiacus]MCX2720403.1 methylmalonyl-CoA mutase subunit beta [Lentiprolixibacter aurantiacus]